MLNKNTSVCFNISFVSVCKSICIKNNYVKNIVLYSILKVKLVSLQTITILLT
nr:MAG TPA: hypothetical protein [Caudoviricetes sp.]